MLAQLAQVFQVLLGTLDFDSTDVDKGEDGGRMRKPDPDAAADMSNPGPLLPEALAKWLFVDLSVWKTSELHVIES